METKKQETKIENNDTNNKGEKAMTTSTKKSTDRKETITENVSNSSTETQLPEGVDEEPRNEEEMHMKYIKHAPSLIDVYLPVSNDKGYLLGDEKLEMDVKSFIKMYKGKEIEEVDNPAVVLSKLRSFYKIYCEGLERAENITDGIQTKSGIRRGELLNIEKTLLKQKSKQWVVHYEETYGKSGLRTAQDHMALAKIPNIIRYSFLGKERLMECLRAIKALGIMHDDPNDDPMAVFFEQYKIAFNPANSQNKETMQDLKLGIDAAVAITRIKKAEEKKETELGVGPDYVKKMIADGTTVNNAFINDLFIIKEEDRDVVEHIKGLVGEGGNEDELLPHIKKLNELPQLVAGLKDTIDSINQHGELVNRVEQGHIDNLERHVSELKDLVQKGIVTG